MKNHTKQKITAKTKMPHAPVAKFILLVLPLSSFLLLPSGYCRCHLRGFHQTNFYDIAIVEACTSLCTCGVLREEIPRYPLALGGVYVRKDEDVKNKLKKEQVLILLWVGFKIFYRIEQTPRRRLK